MRQVSWEELQSHLDQWLDGLDEEGVEIVRDGRPVARVYPAAKRETAPCAHLIGSLRGEFTIQGDVLSTGIKWDAES
jgi:antitoxin (DNA-binding transcriptional repressor) of toxin-antitoxin stability system